MLIFYSLINVRDVTEGVDRIGSQIIMQDVTEGVLWFALEMKRCELIAFTRSTNSFASTECAIQSRDLYGLGQIIQLFCLCI